MTTGYHDKRITVSELSGRLSAVLDEVEAGAAFTVTRHGVPVAVLGPTAHPMASGAETASLVSEDRGEYHAEPPVGLPREPATALARLIGTASTRAVMSVFLLDPTVALHQREIARRAGVGLRSAQIALERLGTLGLFSSERDGNRRYYRAVRTERFEELRALLSREFGVAAVIARHLAELGEPVAWACIFGSAAEEDDTFGSDIDLLVVSDSTDDDLVEPIAAAQRELGRDIDLVSYRPDEFARKRAEGNHFIRSVLAQPRYDVIGGPDGAEPPRV